MRQSLWELNNLQKVIWLGGRRIKTRTQLYSTPNLVFFPSSPLSLQNRAFYCQFYLSALLIFHIQFWSQWYRSKMCEFMGLLFTHRNLVSDDLGTFVFSIFLTHASVWYQSRSFMYCALGTNMFRLCIALSPFYCNRASFSQIYPSTIHRCNIPPSFKNTFPLHLFSLHFLLPHMAITSLRIRRL